MRQQGYTLGYLIAAVIYHHLVPHNTWRAPFWTAAAAIEFLRSLLCCAFFFLKAMSSDLRDRQEQGNTNPVNSTQFEMHIFYNVRNRCPYTIECWSAATNRDVDDRVPHGFQDLYPTYLQESNWFSKADPTIETTTGYLRYDLRRWSRCPSVIGPGLRNSYGGIKGDADFASICPPAASYEVLSTLRGWPSRPTYCVEPLT